MVKRVIVTGGRNYSDVLTLRRALGEISRVWPRFVLVQGGAAGADKIAREWSGGVDCETWRADWKQHGKAAGPIRNKEMLDHGADLVIAFPGGKGTANMVGLAHKHDVPVWEVGSLDDANKLPNWVMLEHP